MDIETLIPKRAVERLYKGVVDGLPRAGEVERNLMLIRLLIEGSASEFSAVVGLEAFGQTVMGSETFEDGDDLLPFDVLVGMYSQAFPGVLIYNGEGSEAPAVEECV